MNLNLPKPPARYKSGSQMARVSTEPWAAQNLYCPACPSPKLHPLKSNTPAKDFCCPNCEEVFQLKGQRKPLGNRIQDSAYRTMAAAIRNDETPSFFALHYDFEEWAVENLILIPRFVLSLSALHKRKPLRPSAQRARWVGCDILLSAIPSDALIPVVSRAVPVKPTIVRDHFSSLKRFARKQVENRGWVMDVWRVVNELNKSEFSLAEVYAAERKLAGLHPKNRHVRDKIRQQLQVLRDLGFLQFLGRGHYRLR